MRHFWEKATILVRYKTAEGIQASRYFWRKAADHFTQRTAQDIIASPQAEELTFLSDSRRPHFYRMPETVEQLVKAFGVSNAYAVVCKTLEAVKRPERDPHKHWRSDVPLIERAAFLVSNIGETAYGAAHEKSFFGRQRQFAIIYFGLKNYSAHLIAPR